MKLIETGYFTDLLKSNKKKAETIFPELLRRLIRISCNIDTYTCFPNGDAIFTPGLDGIVRENKVQHRYIPIGKSIWELGTNVNSLQKVKNDYTKRKCEPIDINKSEYAYVAVSASIISVTKKECFCATAKNDKIFKDVVLLDANDITDWMGEHIDISIWFLQEFGKDIHQYDIALVENEWKTMVCGTKPLLNYDIFLVGNEANSLKFIEDIASQRDTHNYVIASAYFGSEYAFIFAVASICKAENLVLKDRCLIAKSKQGLDLINSCCHNKIVFIDFNCIDFNIINIADNDYVFFDSSLPADISLNLPPKRNFVHCLEGMGITNSSEAYKTAFYSDYNPIVLKRFLSCIPQNKTPHWYREKTKSELIPITLLGEIILDNKGDTEILSSIIGDTTDEYWDILNYWSEQNDSPVFKYDNIFRVSARKDCFNYIKIDLASKRIKNLTFKLKEILLSKAVDFKGVYYDTSNTTPIYRERLIRNIIDGFIILSSKSERNETFFCSYMDILYSNLLNDVTLVLYVAPLLHKMAELSPMAFVSFFKQMLKNGQFVAQVFQQTKETMYASANPIGYFFSALDVCLADADTAYVALDCLVELYYGAIDTNKFIEKKLIEILSPIATLGGIVNIPLRTKIERFFEKAKTESSEKTQVIAKALYENSSNTLMTAVTPTYRKVPKEKLPVVTYQDIFDMQNTAFLWLNQDKDTDIIKLVNSCLHNVNTQPLRRTRDDLTSLKNRINNASLNDEQQTTIYWKISDEISHIKRDNSNTQSFTNELLAMLEDFQDTIEPNEPYLKAKRILTDDNYPLLTPVPMSKPNWYKQEIEARNIERRKTITELISIYGEEIIITIIRDCSRSSWSIWPILYELSADHIRDIKIMMEVNSDAGLSHYLKLLPFDQTKKIITSFTKNEILIKNLPFTDEVISFIDGDKFERAFWQNHLPQSLSNTSFETIYEKYIKFDPPKLLSYFAYLNGDYTYEQGIKLLHTIEKTVTPQHSNAQLSQECYAVTKIVADMDEKYYTSELFQCEFEVLPLIVKDSYDYPKGIKKFFWNNPDQLSNLLISLHKNGQIDYESSGGEIYFSALHIIGSKCFIPQEYLAQKCTHLKMWVDGMLRPLEKESDNQLQRIIKNAIITTLAFCPQAIDNSIWPNKEIADILEELSKNSYDNPYEVSSLFFCAFSSLRGARTIGDGSAEFIESNRFAAYQKKYSITHPIVSKALEYISDSYKNNGERDKKHATLGDL